MRSGGRESLVADGELGPTPKLGAIAASLLAVAIESEQLSAE